MDTALSLENRAAVKNILSQIHSGIFSTSDISKKSLLEIDASLSEYRLLAIALKNETLADQLLALIDFPSLWSREEDYDPIVAKQSINRLLRAFGKDPRYQDVIADPILDS